MTREEREKKAKEVRAIIRQANRVPREPVRVPLRQNPCPHEGQIVEYCPGKDEAKHLRVCVYFDCFCTRGPNRCTQKEVQGEVRACLTCEIHPEAQK